MTIAVADAVNERWRFTPDALGEYCTRNLPRSHPDRFVRPRHVRYQGRQVARHIAAGGQNVAVSQPPQTGKSRLFSVWTVVWFLHITEGRGRVGFASYQDTYAREFGRAVRNIVEEYGDLLGVTVAHDSAAADSWRTTAGGGMWTAGSRGGMTGRSFDLLIIDDPYKDFAEAHSPTIRKRVWEWYLAVARPRVQPGGTKIIVHTRWHEDDLIGKVTGQGTPDVPPEPWHIIALPAIAEPTDRERKAPGFDPDTWRDVLGRRIGEALWPDRYNEQYYATTAALLGAYMFAGIYQQRPSPLTGGMFPRDAWQRCDVLPAGIRRIVRRWDAAFSDTGDWFGTALLAHTDDGRVFVAHVDRIQSGDGAEVDRWIRGIAEEDRDIYGQAKVVHVMEQEPGSGGKRTAKYYVTVVLAGHNARQEPSTGSKDEVRAIPLSSQVKAGNVWLVRERNSARPTGTTPTWFDDFIEEAALFPNGTNDDMIDPACLAYLDLTGVLPQRKKARVRTAAGTSLP